ncbi:MAG: hypothetical protein H6926_07515 [Chromatiales bacterium]|nr:hypothetical protein [Gammaproteobacteria bacterium]MCP5353015.1 hypothetical protein [Chromatiales bacterium]
MAALSARWGWLAVLLAAVLVQSPHLIFGVADPNMDFIAHLLWADQMAASVAAGDWYPRWVHASNYGLGAPALLYYAPGYFWAVAVVDLLLDDLWLSIRTVELLANLITAGFVFALLRTHRVAHHRAVLGAVAAVLAPVPFLVALHFNGLPWAISFAAFAGTAYALLHGERPFGRRADPWVAIGLAVLIVTHTLSGLLALIAFSGLWFLHLATDRPHRHVHALAWLRSWAITVALALCLSAFYLLSAFASFELANTGAWTEVYPPDRSFLFPLFTAPEHGMRWPIMQIWLPLLLLPVLIGAAVYLRRHHAGMSADRRLAIGGLLAVSAVALFFGSELSHPLWMLDTPLRKLQFPFRFAYVLQLTTLLLLFLVCDHAARAGRGWAWWLNGIMLGLYLLVGAALVLRMDFHDGQRLDIDALRSQPFHGIPEFRPANTTLAWRDWVSAGGLEQECRTHGLTCATDVQADRSKVWTLTNAGSGPVSVALDQFDFPTWRLTRDGEPVAHQRTDGTGLIMVEVPPGTHRYLATWEALPVQRVGAWVSFGGLIWLVAMYARRARSA